MWILWGGIYDGLQKSKRDRLQAQGIRFVVLSGQSYATLKTIMTQREFQSGSRCW